MSWDFDSTLRLKCINFGYFYATIGHRLQASNNQCVTWCYLVCHGVLHGVSRSVTWYVTECHVLCHVGLTDQVYILKCFYVHSEDLKVISYFIYKYFEEQFYKMNNLSYLI